MKIRLIYILKYYLFWICYFVFLKLLFLLFYFSKTVTLHINDIGGVFFYGFRLDLSVASYITAAVLLFVVALAYLNNILLKVTIRIITIAAIAITAFIAIADLELYGFWGYRLDTTPLMYLNTPGEMLASIEWYVIVKQFVIYTAILGLSIWGYIAYIEPAITGFKRLKPLYIPLLAIVLGSFIVPIRGGFGLAPLNTGSAYFSEHQFANHAANNVVWNLAFSFTYYKEATKNPFSWTDIQTATHTRDSLYANNGSTTSVLKCKRPNIVLIILESFNDKMIEPLGGMKGVTPNLNKLCNEGICFTNFYCNGDRSDKGLVAIHSGFPAQPVASIIKFPHKTESLPFFTTDLKQAGYNSTYYYGGDIDFAAMRSYIKNAGYETMVSEDDFPSSTYGAKWGVHDEFVFSRVYSDVVNSKSPFIKTMFTLSSHEPFDVPFHSRFNGKSAEQKFLNAGYYTDSCLGDFITKLKKLPLWDSTLVIVTADHGCAYPYSPEYYACIRFKIPLLILGGAVSVHDSAIQRIGSQSDIAYTLLCQLHILPQKKYAYAKNLLANTTSSFAWYCFNSGFGFVTDTGKVVFDNHSHQTLFSEGVVNDRITNIGKSYQQVVYDDFLHR